MTLVRRLAAACGLLLLATADADAAMRIQRVVSPGGIEAWLVEEHAVPLIAMNFAFAGGNSQDPAGKEGVANLLTTMMDEGAGDLDSPAFQARAEDLSMRMGFSAGRDWLNGEVGLLSQHRDASFDLLALALAKPRFDAEAFGRMQAATLSSLRAGARDPDTILGHAWSAATFPGHPYGRPGDGTVATVEKLAPADLRDYHARVFARDHLKIGVVGDIDAATLAPILDRVFGALPAKATLTPVADVTPKTGFNIAKPLDIPQTLIRVSVPGLKRDDPDFIAAFVMNHILGGGSFSSWLYNEVREKRGLAYSVSTSLAPLAHAGLFVGGLGTRADAADESLAIIKAQMKRMAEVGPSADELAKAKAFLIGSYALRFDTSGRIADLLVALQSDNLGIDYVEKRDGLIEQVTLADVRRVAARLLAEPPGVVMVGRVKQP
jgi:zinc protease